MSDLKSVGEPRMVTNTELEKKVDDQEEENRVLREILVEMESKPRAVEEKTEEVSKKAKESKGKGKSVAVEDEVPELDPILQEEPFLRALKAIGGESLDAVLLFSGKMELELVIEWIEGLEKYFECENVAEAQKVKVAKSRLRGASVTWWKFVHYERQKEGMNPISTLEGYGCQD